MKIIFMGTPAFGVRILEKIHTVHEIVMVITQPDKAVGRKQAFVASPVKQFAIEHHLPFMQPLRIKDSIDEITQLDADLIVTAAYGQFIPEKILHFPRYRAINVHGSMLPQYRGGAPIQRAIINGETTTGVSLMYMEKKMDSGDVLMQRKIPIDKEDTTDSLFEKMGELGASMILDVIHGIAKKTSIAVPQDEAGITFANNLTKEDEKLDFTQSAEQIHNRIRGLSSSPGAYFILEGKIIKVYQSKMTDKSHDVESGTIIEVLKHSFIVACGHHTSILFDQIKPEGKNIMSVAAFLNGQGRQLIIKNRRVL